MKLTFVVPASLPNRKASKTVLLYKLAFSKGGSSVVITNHDLARGIIDERLD
jgi:hypothetical protein